MIDDTAAERRATIEQLTDQIVTAAARLAEHITEHPGELLKTAALASALQLQLRLLKHLRRSHLVGGAVAVSEQVGGDRVACVKRHGTVYGYRHGCRCADCRQANTDCCRRSRQRGRGLDVPYMSTLAEGVEPAKHGTESKYSRGCRCNACRHAANAARRARNHADIEAARARWREDNRRKRERASS